MEAGVGGLPRLRCVVLPCMVRSSEAALSALGGEEKLRLALDSNAAQLTFTMPHASGQPQLHSSVVPKKGLLVSIRRKRTDPTDVQTKIVGVVDSSHTFPVPFDFQFIPKADDPLHYRRKFETSMQAAPSPDETLEATPQTFGRSDFSKRAQFLPFTYKRPRPKDDDESDNDDADSDGDEPKSRPINRHHTTTEIVKYQDPTPSHHKEGIYPPRWSHHSRDFRGIVLIDAIRGLLDLVPVLTRGQIVDLLHLQNRQNLLKDSLPFAGYTFSSGPFSHLWVRFGYNPCEDSKAWIYQILQVRFTAKFLQDVSAALVQHIGKEKTSKRTVDLDAMALKDPPQEFSHSFIDKGANARVPISVLNSLLKQQVSYQVSDVPDQEVMDHICSMDRTTRCEMLTGWFTAEGVEGFRVFVVKKVEERVERMCQMADVPNDASTGASDPIDFEDRLGRMRAYLYEGADESVLQGVSATGKRTLAWWKKYQGVAETAGLAVANPGRSVARSRPVPSPATAVPRTQQPVATKVLELGNEKNVMAFDIFANDDTSDSEA